VIAIARDDEYEKSCQAFEGFEGTAVFDERLMQHLDGRLRERINEYRATLPGWGAVVVDAPTMRMVTTAPLNTITTGGPRGGMAIFGDGDPRRLATRFDDDFMHAPVHHEVNAFDRAQYETVIEAMRCDIRRLQRTLEEMKVEQCRDTPFIVKLRREMRNPAPTIKEFIKWLFRAEKPVQ